MSHILNNKDKDKYMRNYITYMNFPLYVCIWNILVLTVFLKKQSWTPLASISVQKEFSTMVNLCSVYNNIFYSIYGISAFLPHLDFFHTLK